MRRKLIAFLAVVALVAAGIFVVARKATIIIYEASSIDLPRERKISGTAPRHAVERLLTASASAERTFCDPRHVGISRFSISVPPRNVGGDSEFG